MASSMRTKSSPVWQGKWSSTSAMCGVRCKDKGCIWVGTNDVSGPGGELRSGIARQGPRAGPPSGSLRVRRQGDSRMTDAELCPPTWPPAEYIGYKVRKWAPGQEDLS